MLTLSMGNAFAVEVGENPLSFEKCSYEIPVVGGQLIVSDFKLVDDSPEYQLIDAKIVNTSNGETADLGCSRYLMHSNPDVQRLEIRCLGQIKRGEEKVAVRVRIHKGEQKLGVVAFGDEALQTFFFVEKVLPLACQ